MPTLLSDDDEDDGDEDDEAELVCLEPSNKTVECAEPLVMNR
jgi:hypothetical protein